jgi:hypothetical protein
MGADEQPLSDERREELLARIQRGGATIGQRIPESVEIAGTEMNLKEFVWETKKQGVVPPEERDRVRSVRSNLKEERERLKERLDEEPLTVAEAEELADTIVGIDRALAALKKLREPDFGREARDREIEDNRRWVKFIDNILD